LLGLVFMPLVEICLVPMNGLGKRDEALHNSKIVDLMDKSTIPLDS
jgi:hypothetical protein